MIFRFFIEYMAGFELRSVWIKLRSVATAVPGLCKLHGEPKSRLFVPTSGVVPRLWHLDGSGPNPDHGEGLLLGQAEHAHPLHRGVHALQEKDLQRLCRWHGVSRCFEAYFFEIISTELQLKLLIYFIFHKLSKNLSLKTTYQLLRRCGDYHYEASKLSKVLVKHIKCECLGKASVAELLWSLLIFIE